MPQRRIRDYLNRGGTLVLACNYFMRGTVTHANRILAGHGLEVIDSDYGKNVTVTNLVNDPLTRDVQCLEFFRPSLILVTDPTKARILAFDPGNRGGFLAVCTPPDGGQIVVLGTSLWWNWIHEYRNGSDNYILMSNIHPTLLVRGHETYRVPDSRPGSSTPFQQKPTNPPCTSHRKLVQSTATHALHCPSCAYCAKKKFEPGRTCPPLL